VSVSSSESDVEYNLFMHALSRAVHNALSWVTCTCDIPRVRGDIAYIAYE